MSRDSAYFKKIQMSLFDLLNHNPIEKYKNKDLLGPLKYLKEDQEAPVEKTLQTTPEEVAVMEHPYTDYVLDLPLVVQRKPYLRHIRFSVKPNSTIHVVAPLNRSLDLIKKEVSEHKLWVEKCNLKFQEFRNRFPVKVFKTGEAFPILGEDFFLRLEAADFKKPFIQMDLDQLQYFYPAKWDLLPKPEKRKLLKTHLMKFYLEKAVLHLNQRVRVWSEKTILFPKRVTFRNQKTRWGSCAADRSLNLNWKLIAFDESIIDYVIIHELCHIKHPNHSQRFWTLVESFCPNYKHLNKLLNESQFTVDFLAAESELYFSNPTLL